MGAAKGEGQAGEERSALGGDARKPGAWRGQGDKRVGGTRVAMGERKGGWLGGCSELEARI